MMSAYFLINIIMAQIQKSEKYLEHLTSSFHFFNKSKEKNKKNVIIDRICMSIIGTLMALLVTGITMDIYLDCTNQNYNDYLSPAMDNVVHNGDFSHNTLNQVMTVEISNHPLAFSTFVSPVTQKNWKSRIYNNAIPEAFDRWATKLKEEKITVKGDVSRQVMYEQHLKEFNLSYDAYFNEIKQDMKPAGLD